MTWLIIAVVLLAAFGPVLWLLPSRRDRRLAALRQAAREAGLVVEIKRIPKTNPRPEERVSAGGVVREPVRDCAAYQWLLQRRLKHLPAWRLLRQEGASDGPWPDWVFEPHVRASEPHLDEVMSLMRRELGSLPAGVIGLEAGERAVLVYWLEGADSGTDDVATIASTLKVLEAQLTALDDEIEAAAADEDS